MSLHSTLIRNITFPLWMMRDGKSDLFKYMKEYRNLDRLPLDKLIERQNSNLQKLINYAYRNTVYYNKVFKHLGMLPSDIRSTEDLIKLPTLTKKDVAENLDDMIASNIDKSLISRDSTGGSTGVPMVFYRDAECFLRRRAQELLFDSWLGYKIGQKVAYFVSGSHHPSTMSSLKALIRNSTCNRYLTFAPDQITEQYMEDFLIKLRKFKPDLLKCFPNALFIFAEYLKKNKVDDIHISSISCTGENLYQYQRELFEEVFHGKVFEKYGTRESGIISCECKEHRGLHVFTEGTAVEYITAEGLPAKPGEVAEVVVTDLFNYGMPLIRYRIGDLALTTDRVCACGSGFPLMESIIGRDRDIIRALDGSQKPGYLFVEIVNKHNIPAKCQFIQLDNERLEVNIVKSGKFTDTHLEVIKRRCKEILGAALVIELNFVDEINRDPSGKYRYVSSNISPFRKQQ